MLFLKQFYLGEFLHRRNISSYETVYSRMIQYLSVHVSPDLLSLYLQSHIIYTAYSPRMAHTITRTLLSFLFYGTNIYCCAILDSPIRHLMNDAYCRLEVAIVYETYFETTPQLINKSIAFIVLPFSEWNAQNVILFSQIIHFYINLLY